MSNTAFTAKTRLVEFKKLVDFATGSQVETGFGYLMSPGKTDPDKPAELWITCRMTHVFSLAALAGDPNALAYAEHGVKALSEYFFDPISGGWFSAIKATLSTDGLAIPVDSRKAAYAHAFVVLAASSAKIANVPGASDLLTLALACQDEHWWEESAQKVFESYDRDWLQTEEYRGVNANMHTTEAYLAAYDATSEQKWLDRALAILRWVIQDQAAVNKWRIPEHFTADWQAQPDYNRDRPKDPFRPYGFTPGHGLEWSRLALHAGAELSKIGIPIPAWLLPGAVALFDRAVSDGWAADGEEGLVYTVDDSGQPVARERMHWVLCEAIGAATCLEKAARGKDGYAQAAQSLPNETRSRLLADIPRLIETWWDYAQRYLIERPGQWIHELDSDNQPSTITWPGKPDAYHVAQMLLLPDLPLAPTFALALKEKD